MFHLRKIQPYQLRHFTTLKVPMTFYKIPYDEQYESRDFIREKVKDDNDKKENNDKDNKETIKEIDIRRNYFFKKVK
tara:strand:+ start:938 stop:1168 length:231 start_codon:yes stop_codon:yes gene_type:complete